MFVFFLGGGGAIYMVGASEWMGSSVLVYIVFLWSVRTTLRIIEIWMRGEWRFQWEIGRDEWRGGNQRAKWTGGNQKGLTVIFVAAVTGMFLLCQYGFLCLFLSILCLCCLSVPVTRREPSCSCDQRVICFMFLVCFCLYCFCLYCVCVICQYNSAYYWNLNE